MAKPVMFVALRRHSIKFSLHAYFFCYNGKHDNKKTEDSIHDNKKTEDSIHDNKKTEDSIHDNKKTEDSIHDNKKTEDSMNIIDSIKSSIIVPIHPTGKPFIVGFITISFIMAFIGKGLFFLSIILTVWCIYFFRNPRRFTPEGAGLVVAPADGKILSVRTLTPPEELNLAGSKTGGKADEGEWCRIAIFMNVFDVHVNRIPIAGKVVYKNHIPGKFVNASLDKASEYNERVNLVLETAHGRVGLVQIAGLVARRILCEQAEGDKLQTGQVYGIIRFGSRVDVWLPAGAAVKIAAGQTAIGGETVIADFSPGAKSIKNVLEH